MKAPPRLLHVPVFIGLNTSTGKTVYEIVTANGDVLAETKHEIVADLLKAALNNNRLLGTVTTR